MTFLKRPSTWLFLIVVFFCWLIIRLDVVPTAVNERPADTAFQVSKAIAHLQQIARVPHSLGTAGNDSVRNYIVSACRSLGLEVEELPFSFVDQWRGGALVARGKNIAATLRGSSSTRKKILVMGHYDSEPNALGAGDDGMACVSMLETARALRAGATLPCDVLFLFTNGEEDGLIGAQAFSNDSALLKNIGLVLNFDGRGDAGKCLMFRTSEDNRWVVDEFARSPIHHSAASLYSELFKLLPNNTDFTPFEKTHIPGMDFAFAEGFVHYHNLTDNVDNLDRRTLEEEGDNMLGSVRHFAQLDLSAAGRAAESFNAPAAPMPSGSTTFFNLVANLFIHYPPAVNFVILFLTNALVLFGLISGLYRRQVRPGQAALGLLFFAITLVLLYFVSSWTLSAIQAAWPLYFGYYPNSYNAYYFYLALAAEALAVFALIYQWLIRKWSMPSLYIAILVFLTIVIDLLYGQIPAGVYFLYFPLIGAALAFLTFYKSTRSMFLGALLPILFLAPLVYSLAELFDLEKEAAVVAPITGILLGLLIPILSPSLRESRWFIPVTALFVMLIAAAFGILQGGYDSRRPLKTDLQYFSRVNDHQAWWVSRALRPDRWNKTFFTSPSLRPNPYQYAHPFPGIIQNLYSRAPYLDLPAPALSVLRDTVINGKRFLYLHCQAAKGTTTIHMNFGHDHLADSIAIAVSNLFGPFDRLDYIAPPDDGFDFVIIGKPGKPFTIDLTGRTIGLPAGAGFSAYPAEVIPTAASWANTTMVQRSYTYQ